MRLQSEMMTAARASLYLSHACRIPMLFIMNESTSNVAQVAGRNIGMRKKAFRSLEQLRHAASREVSAALAFFQVLNDVLRRSGFKAVHVDATALISWKVFEQRPLRGAAQYHIDMLRVLFWAHVVRL